MKRLALVLGISFLAGLVPTLPAAEAAGDLARKAKAVLEKHCYRCHGKEGKAEAGVFVLNRDRLVDRKKLVPGNPGKSRLLKTVIEEEMPPAEVKVRPSADEIAILRNWILAKAPDFAPRIAKRPFIGEQDILKMIASDQQEVRARDRRFVRYFTLTHLHNSGVSDDEMENYRRGLSKLINSLSWGRDIVNPKSIDLVKTIFRIDLRDYKWDVETWQAIVSGYRHGSESAIFG
jgi:mono/diheme cytochrome c family protein